MGNIIAPMAGKVVEINISQGDTVNSGDEIMVIEAMKMEIPINSEFNGTVTEIGCSVGEVVESGHILVTIE